MFYCVNLLSWLLSEPHYYTRMHLCTSCKLNVMKSFITYILALTLCLPSFAYGQEQQLHQFIDQQIADATSRPLAQPSTDAEFLRRIYLDLVGQIPTALEAEQFIGDSSRAKRAKLIDTLLADPRYTRRMTEFFNVMLMERRGADDNWERFLRTSFENNTSWDQLVRDIVSPDTSNEDSRGSAYFLTKRLEKYGQNPTDFPGLARDIGRMFLGMDLACAQCHDHLFIDDYKQADFQGLFAFINNSFIRRDTDFPAIGMQPVKAKLEFNSVFEEGAFSTGPKLPGLTEIPIPEFVAGEEFAIEPNKETKAPGVPKFNPLDYLAKQLPATTNESFNLNAANRIWFLMMGRGLVHPLDLHHSDNPASHPDLLTHMANEFAAHNYNIKWLIREIALSDTYQRTSVVSDGLADAKPKEFRIFHEKPMSAEQLMWSMLAATGQLNLLSADDNSSATADPEAEEEPLLLGLDDIRTDFLAAFANPPREPETEFAPSVRGALFVLNGPRVLSWIPAQPGNLAERLNQQSANYANTLYLAVLSRHPTAVEQDHFDSFISNHPDKTAAIEQAIWALLASNEFAINH